MSDKIEIPRELAENFVKLWSEAVPDQATVDLLRHLKSQLDPSPAYRIGDVRIDAMERIYVRQNNSRPQWAPLTDPGLGWINDDEWVGYGCIFNIEDERKAREQGPVVVHLTDEEAMALSEALVHNAACVRGREKVGKALQSYREAKR